MSEDYRAVFEELTEGDGFTQVFFAGYSMGGNLVTKMAGEYGDAAPRALRGVCAICPALDLASCADALNKRENYFYQRHFVKGLMARYARKAALFPKIYSRDGFGKIRSVRGFDDAITAPCFGYRDAQEYYETASARRIVGNVRVPMLMITAQDDPFVPYESFLAALVADNPAIHFLASGPETAIDDNRARGVVDRTGKTTGTGRIQRRVLRFAHQLKSPRDFFARLAVDAGSRDVGSVAFHSASTIDQDDVAFL